LAFNVRAQYPPNQIEGRARSSCCWPHFTDPLRNAPNLILTPHAAWYSDQAIARLQALVANDIAAHLAGRPLRRPVPESTAGRGGRP